MVEVLLVLVLVTVHQGVTMVAIAIEIIMTPVARAAVEADMKMIMMTTMRRAVAVDYLRGLVADTATLPDRVHTHDRALVLVHDLTPHRALAHDHAPTHADVPTRAHDHARHDVRDHTPGLIHAIDLVHTRHARDPDHRAQDDATISVALRLIRGLGLGLGHDHDHGREGRDRIHEGQGLARIAALVHDLGLLGTRDRGIVHTHVRDQGRGPVLELLDPLQRPTRARPSNADLYSRIMMFRLFLSGVVCYITMLFYTGAPRIWRARFHPVALHSRPN